MILKILKNALVIVLVMLLQVAIFPNWGQIFMNMNVVLATIVFVSVAYHFYYGVIYALILGFLLDLYSPSIFGVNVVCFLLTLYLVYLISRKLLTNKSLYSLMGLVLSATIFLFLAFYLVQVSNIFIETKDFSLIKGFTLVNINNFAWQLILNLVLTLVLFFIFNFSSKQFKAVFIDTTKN